MELTLIYKVFERSPTSTFLKKFAYELRKSGFVINELDYSSNNQPGNNVLLNYDVDYFKDSSEFMRICAKYKSPKILIHNTKIIDSVTWDEIKTKKIFTFSKKISEKIKKAKLLPIPCDSFTENEVTEPRRILAYGSEKIYRGWDRLKLISERVKTEVPDAKFVVMGTRELNFYDFKKSVGKSVEYVTGNWSETSILDAIAKSEICVFPYSILPHVGIDKSVLACLSMNRPAVFSKNELFDDFGLKQNEKPEEIADEIISILKDKKYKNNVLKKQKAFVKKHSWDSILEKVTKNIF